MVSFVRNAFNDEEVLKIVSQPLFTGCVGHDDYWTKGPSFFQNHLYWAFLLSLFTGLRPGEFGRLEINDFVKKESIWYLQIRGFDPAKGRVAREHVKKFKTKSAERLVPLQPIIIDLGFLERLEKLESIGCRVVFPEWKPYLPANGNPQWGRPLTRFWEHMKKQVNITRKDVSQYSTRHWFAHLLDDTDLSHSGRKKALGHSDTSDIPVLYGDKTQYTRKDIKALYGLTSPVIVEITEILLEAKWKADNGDLKRIDHFSHRLNWSDYYNKEADNGWPSFQRAN